MPIETKIKKAIECSRCGNDMNEEEADNPRLDRADDQPICDECWHEHYEFTCCDCCNYGDVKDQHNMLVVFEPVDSMGGQSRTITPGIYKVINGPYHGGPLIGSGYLFGGNLERIADVNPDMDGNGYPCGHLCKECQGRVLAQFTAKCKECETEKASCLRVQTGGWRKITKHSVDDFRWNRAKVLCADCRHRVTIQGDKTPSQKHWRVAKAKGGA